METFKTFLRPVIDLKVGSGHEVAKTVQWTVFSESPSSYAARGAQIRRQSRRLRNWKLLTFALARIGIKRLKKLRGYSVHDLQVIFGFDYPQAIYAWEQGKNAPTIDNLLVLSYLFDVNISEIVVSSNIEIKLYNAEKTA